MFLCEAQIFWILWIFFIMPQLCMGSFDHWVFSHFPPVWGVILVKVIFKNVIGSKWDCKGYISALWKDYQRWSSSSQTHTLRIDRSCFHARMQSDLFIQIKLSFWVTSWGFFFVFVLSFSFKFSRYIVTLLRNHLNF